MPSQHGFRPNHSPDDVLYDLFTQMEDALLGGEPLFGLALDFAKCFDRVPQSLTLELVEKMGLHPRILKPLRAMYKNLERRFKYNIGVGTEFSVTNGILQGCPISVILINALLSVMIRRIASDVPTSSTPSFADDAYLLSRESETDVADCLRIVEKFCDTTGMLLNETKTLAFSSKKNHTCRLTSNSGHTFVTAEKLKALGTTFCCHDSPTARHNPEKYAQASSGLARLQGTPLSSMNKADIVASAILPATLYETAYTTPCATTLGSLTQSVTTCVWGPAFPTRSPAAVLTICTKAHTTNPATIIAYRQANTFLRSTARGSEIRRRCQRIVQRYKQKTPTRTNKLPAAGPVGNLINTFHKHGLAWNADLSGVYQEAAPSQTHKLQGLCKREQRHIIRSLLRAPAWKALAERRPTFSGIWPAIDTTTTNRWWKSLLWSDPENAHRIRRIICGALLYCHPNGLKRAGLPDVDFSHRCPLCLVLTDCHTRHLLWECSHTSSEALRKKHRTALSFKSSELPPCLALHGIAPAGHDATQVQQIQSLLLDRTRLLDKALADPHGTQATPMHPWVPDFPTTRARVAKQAIYQSLGLYLTRWEKTRTYKFLKWTDQLLWSNTTRHVSCIELALDFEITMNCLICRTDTTSVRERAREMKKLITKINDRSRRNGFRHPFLGQSVDRVHSLRSIGAPALIGFSRRPKLHPWTIRILEEQVAKAKPQASGWANELVPDYAVLEADEPHTNGR